MDGYSRESGLFFFLLIACGCVSCRIFLLNSDIWSKKVARLLRSCPVCWMKCFFSSWQLPRQGAVLRILILKLCCWIHSHQQRLYKAVQRRPSLFLSNPFFPVEKEAKMLFWYPDLAFENIQGIHFHLSGTRPCVVINRSYHSVPDLKGNVFAVKQNHIWKRWCKYHSIKETQDTLQWIFRYFVPGKLKERSVKMDFETELIREAT